MKILRNFAFAASNILDAPKTILPTQPKPTPHENPPETDTNGNIKGK